MKIYVIFVIIEEFVATIMQLTEEQLNAIQTPGSLTVTASAGTGKTTVLTKRFLSCFVERRMDPYRIVAFTFTEKASHEMKNRILISDQMPFDVAAELHISTIHAFCRKILLNHGKVLGLGENFDIHDEQSFQLWQEFRTEQWLRQNLEKPEHVLTHFCKKYTFNNLKKSVSQLFELNLCAVPETQIKCLDGSHNADSELLNDFLRVNSEFQNELLRERMKQNLLNYDDLEILTLKLFDKHPQILAEIQKKFCEILVDEFQDVSPRQFDLIRKMFNPTCNEIFIVGDPKQAIYGFRGSDSRLFTRMADIIQTAGGKSIYLHETFRTPQKIQNQFNKVFGKIFDEKIFQPATSHQSIDSGIYLSEIPPETENSDQIRQAQSLQIANRIVGLIENGVNANSIAILGYTKNVLPVYKQALAQKKIPTTMHDPVLLLDVPVIQTAWHILNYLGDSEAKNFDKISQIGILRNPIFNFTETFIDQRVKSNADNIFFEQTIDLFASHSDKTNWEYLTTCLKTWQELSLKLPAAELFQKVIDDIKPNLSASEMMLCEDFYNLLLTWQKQGLDTIMQTRFFLKNLSKKNIKSSISQNSSDGVRLMSIHAAKGLEFDHVFLIPGKNRNNDSPLFLFKKDVGFIFKTPDVDQEKSLKCELTETESFIFEKEESTLRDKEELARLIYVALTRVKKKLYLFCDKPTQVLLKSLKSNPGDVTALKSYNDWLYYVLSNFSCSALR